MGQDVRSNLLDQRNRLIHQQREMLDAAGTNALSADDSVKYDEMDRDVDALQATIDRHERMDAKPAITETRAAVQSQPETAVVQNQSDVLASEEYRTAFYKGLFGKAKLTETESRALEAGVTSEGGAFVPTITESRIVSGLNEANFMRTLGSVFQVSGKTNIPAVSTSGTATIVDEEASISSSDGTYSSLSFTPWKLSTGVLVSNELIEDSAFDLASWLESELTRRLAAGEQTYMVNGDGSSKPQGWMNGVTAGPTAAGAAAIAADEIWDLFFTVPSAYRANAVWMIKDATLAAVRKLKTTTNEYIYAPGFAGGQDTLVGRPVYTSSDMDAMTSGKRSIVVGDPSWYYIADQGSTRVEVSRERYFETDQTFVKAIRRFDAKISLADSGRCLVQA